MRLASVALSAAMLSAGGAAFAGGYAAPVIETAPVIVAPTPETPAWEGGYAGVALGYAFGGDDDIGYRTPAGRLLGDLGSAELSGINGTIRAGYRWQRNSWVIGPELSLTGGSIEDDFDNESGFGVPGDFESKVNHTLALKLKTGYLVRPDTLVYGIAGAQRGDFTYNYAGNDIDYDASGYVVGLGVERQMNERMSVTGEWEYADFGETEVDLGNGFTTQATPKFQNFKVGVNFKF